MTILQIISVLLTVAALASYLNHQYLRLPRTIGLMAITLTLSLGFVVLGMLNIIDLTHAATFVRSIDFSGVLLHGMLALLLFAGALHVDIDDLRSQKLPIAVLSTAGVVLATFITGLLIWIVAGWLGTGVPFVYALLFGALISPTDPIAVLGILRRVGAPKSLEAMITGESLFNDGVGVVVFLTILDIALGPQGLSMSKIAAFFAIEAIGGVLFGLLGGWIFYRLLKSVDNYQVETLLTLALATGGYALAEAIHVSAPIGIVVAGLFIGNHGRSFAMSERTREHLDTFWELIDEIMNAILFVLIGLEVIAVNLGSANLATALAAIVVVLLARFISVYVSVAAMRFFRSFSKGIIEILTWGGLRGGISIALALSLPPVPERHLILASTYVVVVFSILVQGLTIGKVVSARRASVH
jgi:CPA1 family monovalent cation:H+ antiporter